VSVRAKVASVDAVRDFLSRVDRPATGRGQLHVIAVEHADPDNLAKILSALQSGDTGRIKAARGGTVDPVTGGNLLAGRSFSVVVDPPTHSLVVQADPDTAAVLADVVAELDIIPRQVDVEVTVVEISTTRGVDLAFDFLLPLTDVDSVDDPIAFVSGMPSGSASSLFAGTPVEQTFAPIVGLPPVDKALLARIAREPVLVPVVVNGQVVPVAIPRDTAAITAQDQTIYTRMILRPRLTVISGEEHEIFVGDNVPILTASANTGGDPLVTSQNVERQDVGVVLRVRPTLGEKGGIVLDLTTEISALAGTLSATTANLGPTIRERTLTTSVRLEHDRVAVIGWHSGPASMQARTGTPWFEDIPVFGWLFRSTNDISLESNLVIMVAAWIDDPEVHALAHMLANALHHEAPELAAPGGANRSTMP
jgi:general secretion pathway protein D